MPRSTSRAIASRGLVLAVVFGATAAPTVAHAQDARSPYPTMAPVEQYRMDRTAEITLARSAAPESVSRDAEILVLGRQGYETAVKGRNGFACAVARSWAAGTDDPGFWNPKVRAPICFNALAARSFLALIRKRTELVLAGRSKAQIAADIKAAFEKKELPTPDVGAMCYMLSKQQYLNDRDAHWHPHVMVLAPPTDPASWGANLPDSPVFGDEEVADHMTVFFIPVANWSDGTAGPVGGH